MTISPIVSEYARDPRVCMDELRFQAEYSLVMQNMRLGIKAEFDPKTLVSLRKADGSELDYKSAAELDKALSPVKPQATAEGVQPQAADGSQLEPDDTFVNVVRITGSMSRSGDACTYGSKDHKRMMRRAAMDSRCRGHILHINSGGGHAGTVDDYREAINFCLERGQNVVAVIDECAASAACFTANMTNRIFAMREKDEIGSLGMFAAFTTIADGTTIPYSNEVLHIRYADQSVDKNRAFRDATDGDLSKIDQMLHDDLAQMLADTQKDRPSLTADQLTGKMYPARDVMGTMVDEIGGIEAATEWLVNDFNTRKGAALPLKEEAEPVAKTASACDPCDPQEPKDPEQDPDNDPNTNPEDDKTQEGEAKNSSLLTPHSSLKNSAMYENIASALGLESIESSADGVMLNTALADQMEAVLQGHADALAAKDKAMADALAAKEQEINDLKQAQEKTLADLKEANDKALADLAESNKKALADAETAHNEAIEKLNAEHKEALDGVNASLATANDNLGKANEQLTAANQRVTDLTAEVENLNNAQQAQPQAGQQPAGNGQQSEQPAKIAVAGLAYDPSMSAREYAQKRKEAMQK